MRSTASCGIPLRSCPSESRTCRAGSNWCAADLLDQLSLINAVQPHGRTRSTTSPAHRSSPVMAAAGDELEVTGMGVVPLLEAMRVTDSRSASTRRRRADVRSAAWRRRTRRLPRPAESLRGRRSSSGIGWCSATGRSRPVRRLRDPRNHKSPRRGLEFVTRKITDAVAESRSASTIRSRSATSMPAGTGASRATTCARWANAPATRPPRAT